MLYVSTRGKTAPQKFCDILLGGLAPDGGLYLPETYPQITRKELDDWRQLSYPDLAYAILSKFIDDIPPKDLREIIDKTYTAKAFRFSRNGGDPQNITPLTKLENGLFLLELSNGPTLAFKDVALQLLGNLFEYVLERRGEHLNILGATSGDTGSAAEYGVLGKRNIKIFMLSPEGRMSAFQRAQMYSIDDQNVFNIAVRGTFDDAQRVVKGVFDDSSFKKKYRIGAVNSINWARIVAQIVYYFWGYFRTTTNNDKWVAFAVPSGNFGNICAGHIARQMALPIEELILATNENDVLDEFFQNFVYRPRSSSETSITPSPSMDIQLASNFERFIYDMVGGDSDVVRDLWSKLSKEGSFDLTGTEFAERIADFGIISGKCERADCLATIKMAFAKYGVTIDTHTAVGLKVALEYRLPGTPLIVMETAQPAKFEDAIEEALGFKPGRPAELNGIEGLEQRVVVMDPDADDIKRFIMDNC